ncbi:hypothetical protein P030_06100 [Anaplasma phagocytophilum str. CRT35]|nr:hypothetical protein P030_06100 [Anaplasma phagocytophilum str. CRT35]
MSLFLIVLHLENGSVDQVLSLRKRGNFSTARASLPSEYATTAAEIIRQTVMEAIQNSGDHKTNCYGGNSKQRSIGIQENGLD